MKKNRSTRATFHAAKSSGIFEDLYTSMKQAEAIAKGEMQPASVTCYKTIERAGQNQPEREVFSEKELLNGLDAHTSHADKTGHCL